MRERPTVDVWRVELDRGAWPPAAELPPPERERAERILRPAAARRWAASRWALREILGGYLSAAPAAIELELGEHGKPRLAAAGRRLEFNLSHCGELALLAVSEGRPVGIDIERVDPRRNVLALAERELDPEAVEAVRGAPAADRAEVFYRAWASHEARLKCLGVGLAGPASPSALATAPVEVPGHAAAVAIPGPVSPAIRHRR